ncbi:MAG: heavy metal translocating P-type ATPase [Ruminococcus sp.]|nr:heavy metal translocating P-type ATPase [Ruminococcus sp.]
MKQYNVTGMSCAACSARVEKAVNAVPGVTSCAVSLLTNSMGVEGSASPEEIISAVKNAGYGASVKGESSAKTADESSLEDTETPKLKKRLIASLFFLAVLMYMSMGHMMWGWPLPGFFEGNHVAMGLAQLLLAAIVMVINQKFFISGFKSLLHRSPNMDTLVAMGSAASFVWSVINLFAMTRAQADGDSEAVMSYMHDFWFESAAMILTLITVGKMLEARSKGKTTDALKGLMKLAPKTAVVERDGGEVTIPAEQVKIGDIFVVRPGENIPVDGVVIEGVSAVNEASLTGESIPADKSVGDSVSSGTINQSGFIRCQATHVGEDTTLSRIIKMVSEASATKAPIAKIADKVSGIFVPVVIGIAVLTTAIWLLVGQDLSFALARGISVLVISCPCALGLATPVAIMVGSGIGARSGILFKTAVSLEETGKVQIVALDKTGTITSGEPVVTDIVPAEGCSEEELLSLAFSLEKMSEHPLAGAVVKLAEERSVKAEPVEDLTSLPGNGLRASLSGEELIGGSMKFVGGLLPVGHEISAKAEELASQGKTPMLFAHGERLLGMIAVADVIKEDSPKAVAELKKMGIKVVMLTGDNQRTAKAIGQQAGVDEVIAGVLPDGKESVIRRLMEKGKVAMVGDGINDAPALTRADTGIAIGAGTDVAIDAADIVLMKSRLTDVSAAIRLSRAVIRNIKQNLFWAFIYNIIGIPLAAGAYAHLFGWTLDPMYGAAAMSLSSFFVVTNALRLNLINIHDPKHDKPLKEPVGQLDMTSGEPSGERKTIRIKGMMCPHCEARVKSALEELPFVEEAVPSHEAGNAVVTLSGELSEKEVKAAIEKAGYKYFGTK